MKIKDVFKKITGSKAQNNYFYPSFVSIGSAKWNHLQNDLALIKAFDETPDANFVIRYLVKQATKLKFGLYRTQTDGSKVWIGDLSTPENHDILKMFANPNPLQNYSSLFGMFFAYYCVLGNSYYNFFAPVGMKPDRMYVLPAQYIQILTSSQEFGSDYRTDEVKKYVMNYRTPINIDPEFILHKKDINLSFENKAYLFGKSPLLSSERPINSIMSAYEAGVTTLQKRGALGILTSKGGSEFTSPTPQQIEEVQNKFQEYGLSRDQYQYIITEAPLEWQQMSMNIKDLMIDETQKRDRTTICNQYSVSGLIFETDASAMNNRKEANRQTWEGNLISWTEDYFNDLTEALRRYWDEPIQLIPDYTSIPELKDDLEKKKTIVIDLIKHGVLTPNEGREEINRDPLNTPGMDQPYILNGLVPVESKVIPEEEEEEPDPDPIQQQQQQNANDDE